MRARVAYDARIKGTAEEAENHPRKKDEKKIKKMQKNFVGKIFFVPLHRQTNFLHAMKKPAIFTITTPANLAEWKNNHNANQANALCEFAEKSPALPWLRRCCAKQFNKYGGLDLGYLSESSTLKSITRECRRASRERYTMDDDRAARVYLAASILEWCAEGE